MMKMNEQSLNDAMMEVREDFMVSPAGDSEPTHRMAHFLKPVANGVLRPTVLCFHLVKQQSLWKMSYGFGGLPCAW
jgi:hypothetical protein